MAVHATIKAIFNAHSSCVGINGEYTFFSEVSSLFLFFLLQKMTKITC